MKKSLMLRTAGLALLGLIAITNVGCVTDSPYVPNHATYDRDEEGHHVGFDAPAFGGQLVIRNRRDN